jgi:hypothetical protein
MQNATGTLRPLTSFDAPRPKAEKVARWVSPCFGTVYANEEPPLKRSSRGTRKGVTDQKRSAARADSRHGKSASETVPAPGPAHRSRPPKARRESFAAPAVSA